VAEGVEVGAELHGRGDLLDHPVHVVVAAAAVQVGVVGGGDEGLAEVAAVEDRDALVELVPQVVEAPLADEPQRLEPLLIGAVLEAADLVVLAERRGPPLLLGGD
jgi:hypothetical protein